MKKKWKIALLVCFTVVSVAFVSQRIVSKQGETILSEKQIQSIVSEQYPGKIKSMKLINKEEQDFYKVNLLNEQGSYEIIVDAKNGEIKRAKEKSLKSNTITKEKAEEMALQKVQGEIKHTILEKRNEIEVFVITVETNDKQSKVVEIEKTTGQIQLLEKPMTKVTEEQAKEIAVQQVPGNVKGIRLEQKNEKNIYVIEIEKNANENVIVEIEETTGAFIGTSQIQKVITEEQAKEVALQKVQGGFIEKVSIVDINGTATYQIIIKKQTETVDVRVHTITGEIISTTSVNNTIQQKESSQQQDDDHQEESDDDPDDDDDEG
ncbi:MULTISPECIES: PepSY domain-containing protein [Bacillus cereus group]|uniref:PepSY domain-containing protein n=1 Tax=Bacillus cereus group TaxID=86661 RepID=UPI00097763AF|nr:MULTISPECIES: PepSY domain-containing protein [Bacillus cereus group]MCU5322511.1 PepSY domain-containing protein [Bacillus cereus]MDA2311185.1 PepSY domain-containing protein [Bacillus cereus]MDA2316324.1 PepSY domain-containing protein [Bacillus cereus]MDA2500095.1 PepSY domain-containing protein [Bacillus cereus]MDF9611953.1 PepSY domain-containing protein [Bacillus cereus]